MNFSKGKKNPYFVNQSTRIFSQNKRGGETTMTIEKNCQKGEIKDGKCNIFKKFNQMIGFRKNFKGWICKKMKMCEDKKKGLKRVSCQNTIGNSDGWAWDAKEKEEQNGVQRMSHNWGSHAKSKIKRKIVYKDEFGNVIDADKVKNGEYVRKDELEED
jgi:hypothetical protein